MNRRLFLRTAAATLWLPFLESAPGAAPPAPVRRTIWLYVPNGFLASAVTPSRDGAGYPMPAPLAPLEALRDRATIVSGLRNLAEGAIGGYATHESCAASLLTDRSLPGSYYLGDARLGVSVDQHAVAALRPPTPFPSMQLGTGETWIEAGGNLDLYYNALSWANAATPLPALTNPAAVFARMFAGADPAASAEDVARRTALRGSVLDAVRDRSRALAGALDAADRTKLDQYESAVRDVERRIAGLAELTCPTPPAPAGSLAFVERLDALTDLLVVALQCDHTRVATLMAGVTTSLTSFPFLGISTDHHTLSHDWAYDDRKRADYLTVQSWYVQRFVDLCRRLAEVPDPEGDLLATTLVTLLSEFGDGNLHTGTPNVFFCAGGEAAGLVHGVHRDARDAPHANYLRATLDFLGVDPAGFGPNATGTLDLRG